MRIRVVVLALAGASVLGLVACSSSSDSGSSNSTTTPTTTNGLHVETPEGQVSLSWNGQLSPNWTSSFPVPHSATVAGSGSLVNSSSGAMVGVYKTSQSPSDAYNFYKTNSSLTVTSSQSAGANTTTTT